MKNTQFGGKMSKKEKPDFNNELKRIDIKDMENAIAKAITELVNSKNHAYECDIKNIYYRGIAGAMLNLHIYW